MATAFYDVILRMLRRNLNFLYLCLSVCLLLVSVSSLTYGSDVVEVVVTRRNKANAIVFCPYPDIGVLNDIQQIFRYGLKQVKPENCSDKGCFYKIENSIFKVESLITCNIFIKMEKVKTHVFNLLVVDDTTFKCNPTKTENLFGSSDCRNVHQSIISRSCSLGVYNPNQEKISLVWKFYNKDDQEVSFDEKIPTILQNPTLDPSKPSEYEVQDSVKVTKEMDGLRLECRLTAGNTHITVCSLDKLSVQYAENTTSKLPTQLITEAKPVNCSARTSSKRCSYSWQHSVESENSLPEHHTIEGAQLNATHIKSPGLYSCIAKCQMDDGAECSLLSEMLEVEGEIGGNKPAAAGVSALVSGMAAGAVLLVLLVLFILLFWLYRRRKAQKESKPTDGNELKKLNPASNGSQSNNSQQTTSQTATQPAQTTTTTTAASQQQTATTSSSTSTNTSAGTPLPRSQQPPPNFGRPSKTHSFKKSHSSNSSITAIPEEPTAGSRTLTQIGQRMTLNDVAPDTVIRGVCHLGSRIYCVCEKFDRIFTFVDENPYNRIKGEEVVITSMLMASDLAVCYLSNSLYVCDYSAKQPAIYRIFPHLSAEDRVCKGLVDGVPASCTVDPTTKHRIVVILKRDKEMFVEIYDTSSTFSTSDSVYEKATWQKISVIKLQADARLPMKLCVSLLTDKANEAGDGASCQQKILYVLYGSGKYDKNEFASYKISRHIMETGRILEEAYDLSELNLFIDGSKKFKSSCMVSVDSSSVKTIPEGVIIIQESSKPCLIHVDKELKHPSKRLQLDRVAWRGCTHSKLNAIVVTVPGGGKQYPQLAVHNIGADAHVV